MGRFLAVPPPFPLSASRRGGQGVRSERRERGGPEVRSSRNLLSASSHCGSASPVARRYALVSKTARAGRTARVGYSAVVHGSSNDRTPSRVNTHSATSNQLAVPSFATWMTPVVPRETRVHVATATSRV